MDRLRVSRQSLQQAVLGNGLVPVLGPEAIWVTFDDAPATDSPPVSFYARVARQLLADYGFDDAAASTLDTSPSWPLHQAVALVLQEQPRTTIERMRRSVATIVADLSKRVRTAPLLDRLAALSPFDLFVCLTPDELLAAALRRARGEAAVQAIAYSPSKDSRIESDLPDRGPGGTCVFHPLGLVSASARAAVHDEDALEYLFRFQQEAPARMPRLLETLRRRDLLLMGCRMPDWLGLGLIRMANEVRLSAQEKKMEFFAADAQPGDLADFLARYNPNATVFPWTAAEFVTELEGIVRGKADAGRAAVPVAAPAAPAGTTADTRATVFVSYASEDREAVIRLCDGLLAAGFDDVWLDQRQLRGGDDWSQRIDEAIERCTYFVPVLSRQADARGEGVFWAEWRKAMARAMRIHDAFLLPIGIDELAPDRAGYRRIFGGFCHDLRALHLLHAPKGLLAPAAQEDLRLRATHARGPGGG